jgi:hypothetical protein
LCNLADLSAPDGSSSFAVSLANVSFPALHVGSLPGLGCTIQATITRQDEFGIFVQVCHLSATCFVTGSCSVQPLRQREMERYFLDVNGDTEKADKYHITNTAPFGL